MNANQNRVFLWRCSKPKSLYLMSIFCLPDLRLVMFHHFSHQRYEICITTAVPNLFGTGDQFLEDNFSMDRGGGDAFGMI